MQLVVDIVDHEFGEPGCVFDWIDTRYSLSWLTFQVDFIPVLSSFRKIIVNEVIYDTYVVEIVAALGNPVVVGEIFGVDVFRFFPIWFQERGRKNGFLGFRVRIHQSVIRVRLFGATAEEEHILHDARGRIGSVVEFDWFTQLFYAYEKGEVHHV